MREKQRREKKKKKKTNNERENMWWHVHECFCLTRAVCIRSKCSRKSRVKCTCLQIVNENNAVSSFVNCIGTCPCNLRARHSSTDVSDEEHVNLLLVDFRRHYIDIKETCLSAATEQKYFRSMEFFIGYSAKSKPTKQKCRESSC